jgi:hypothetical protein
MTKIPTDVQMMFRLHFFTSSSSHHDKRSFMTAIVRNMTAIAIKKFFMLNAIVINVFFTESPAVLGVKKNSLTPPIKVSSVSLEAEVTVTDSSLR